MLHLGDRTYDSTLTACSQDVSIPACATVGDHIRRHKRRQAWDRAVKVRNLLDGENSRILAIETALGTGFFSVWMAVFKDDNDMRQRLTEAFPGTCVE